MSDNQSTDELYTFEEPPAPQSSAGRRGNPKIQAARAAAKANPGQWVKVTDVYAAHGTRAKREGFEAAVRSLSQQTNRGDLYLRWPVS